MNTSNHLSTFTAQNNSIVLNYANHTFVSGDYVYLHFDTNASSNLVNTVYTVNSTNANYIFVNNPKTETVSGNTGNARVFKPVIMINVPYSQPSVNSNVYLQFKTVDPSLINTYYQVVGTVGTNTFNVLHPNMVTANDSANVANLITKKITVTANNHQFNVGDQAYVLLINGDTANTHNGYYTVTAVGSPNTFNVQASNVIFAGSSARVYQKYSTITIANHPLANGTNVYISFVGGDQANASNGIYAPVKISSNQMVLNVAKPTTANSNVRVWYSTNNYSNITFTEFRTSSNVTAGQNVEIRYNASGADLANGFYTVISKYTSNSYNVHYTSNNSIVNATSTYGSQVFIPGGMNTINAISHSGVGIVANSVMEGIAYVSPYK
jgi:hypothetical protein